VTVSDLTAPVISDFESEVFVSCLEEVPAPEMLTAFDDCSGAEAEVVIFESNNGELVASCDLSTAFGTGDDWALWLPTLMWDGFSATPNSISMQKVVNSISLLMELLTCMEHVSMTTTHLRSS